MDISTEQKMTVRIDAEVCYLQTYHIEWQNAASSLKAYVSSAMSALKKQFDGILFAEDETGHPVFCDIKAAQEFLHSSKLPFATERMILNSFRLSHADLPVTGNVVMVCAYPEIGILSIMVNLSLRGATTEQMVFLRHMQGNGAPLQQTDSAGNQTKLSVSQIIAQVENAVGEGLSRSKSAYMIEIRNLGEYTDALLLKEQEANRLYGILTGDEGWRFVPEEVTKRTLNTNTWSSRKHMSVTAFSTNFLLINLVDCPAAGDYLSGQRKFFASYYGDVNPYFTMQPAFAGVAHGLLFTVETGLIIQSFSQGILDRQSAYTNRKKTSFRNSVFELKLFRKQIILTLNRVENLQISEISELQIIVLESLNINPVIDRLKYLLELMESEMDLMYSTRTNTVVNLIAIVGLIFSLIEVLGLFIDF